MVFFTNFQRRGPFSPIRNHQCEGSNILNHCVSQQQDDSVFTCVYCRGLHVRGRTEGHQWPPVARGPCNEEHCHIVYILVSVRWVVDIRNSVTELK